MKRVFCALLLFFCISTLLAEMRVTNVTAKSHFPWDGKIDITYWLEGGEESHGGFVSFMGHDNVHGVDLPAKSVSGVILRLNGGPYTATWDYGADYPNSIQTDMVVDVNVVKGQLLASFTKAYVCVNLLTGESWDSSVGPDLSDDTCRTTELWLRRIPKGTFMMGSPTGEVGRDSDETQHQVTLTQDYYIGVFEMTQKQYDLIYGSNPSWSKGDVCPVEWVSYNTIRGTGATAGAGWPMYGHAVDEGSFLGKLRAKTGLVFDLPTEAQWEYACRAGTTTALNTGKNLTSTSKDPAMDEAGRYEYNRDDGKGGYGEHAKVGSYLPNAWGLYDMHGNVDEWCLDWYGDYPFGAVTDPVGPDEGSYRVLRGGYWNYIFARFCRSAFRYSSDPSGVYGYYGFRVVCLPPPTHILSVNNEETLCDDGNMVTVTAPEKFGYVFKDWTANGITLSEAEMTTATISFTMPANDVTLVAEYTPNMYTLTVDGKSEQVAYGTAVTRTAPEKTGHTFSYWTINGVSVSNRASNPISFTMPANDVTLATNYGQIASFQRDYVYVDLLTGLAWDSETGPDLSRDTCRTTELWLRRIPKGTFMMGSPTGEVGRDSEETQHQVRLTQDYYIGVFEMTQKQYELIYGSNPSEFKGDCRPVEQVSYNTIRGTGGTAGAGWPQYGHAVDSGSFLGRLRAMTGLVFDLPTEAQWEYACRVGTTTALNTGRNLTDKFQDPAMDEAGRYWYNMKDGKGGYSQHTKVGSYLPNAWGLYDMHGNVCEWCLDWYGGYPSEAVTDPVGPQSGSSRVLRGGCWYNDAYYCRSAIRYYGYPSGANYNTFGHGFRVVCLPQ